MAKLLIIDDERGIRNTLKEILADEGHEVDVAENGKLGLEMAQAKSFDLIFSDIKMPEMDGIEFLTALKSGDEPSDAPIVMISGHGDVETAVQALKLGAYDFLLKPLDLNRILITTKNALESKNLKQETKQLELSTVVLSVTKRNRKRSRGAPYSRELRACEWTYGRSQLCRYSKRID